jgi:hypothetical protein
LVRLLSAFCSPIRVIRASQSPSITVTGAHAWQVKPSVKQNHNRCKDMTTEQHLSLDGVWDFQIDPNGGDDILSIKAWRAAQTPMPWQAQFDDLRQYSGVAWYRRRFDWSTDLTGKAVILSFGAVDYHATVWLNGRRAGEHEGGYLPFAFDVTDLLQPGENVLIVRVEDASDDRSRFPNAPFSEVPHGKQSWYGPIGGIWQSVTLAVLPAVHIKAVKLTPSPADNAIDIAATLNATALPQGAVLTAAVLDPGGQVVAATQLDDAGVGRAVLTAPAQWWSPESPVLYTVVTTLASYGETHHETRHTCGFRTVEARDGRIYLNGQPIYLRGVLDQAYYPESIYTPPSLEFLEDQARKAKALGLNCLRIHIKIEDPRYYEVADRFGLLVWTEIPNWVFLTDAADRRIKETFREMVARDWNHPSIIAWTLVNENWGTDLVRNPEHRRWLADFYHEAKAIDPTRLIVDNSGCCDNFHVAGDLEDFHHYRAIPDHAKEWDEWVADFASRENNWIWAQDYLTERRADLPLIVSEFGNWGLPDPATIQEDGRDPWWFETGHEWGDGIVYPHAMPQRFVDHGLDAVFGSMEAFARAAQAHMARSLHYEISSMRLLPSIAGYIITEFTDVHWECNGLLTMQRQVKHGLDTIFTPINQDNVVTLRPQRWSGKVGDLLTIDVSVFAVDGKASEGVIAWRAGDTHGQVDAPGGAISAPLAAPGMVTVEARWLGADDAVIATNAVEVACIVAPQHRPEALCVLDDPALAAALRTLGYHVSEEFPQSTDPQVLLVSHRYTKRLEAAVQAGARLLLLAGEPGAGAEEATRLPVGAVVPREGTPWQGDWATAFSWIRKQGAFATLPGSPLLEMEYAPVMPDLILVGLPSWAYRTHSWAGLALGWIHKPVSLLAEMPYGRGHMAITTFKLNATTLTEDVVAQTIFAGALALLT